ncbi:hypothetical protein RND71_006358 [Anisodus tanguticus]|uniref:Uncharacterized protein n=1 Tax=Anisodus tanguticus TaxID=243964 RepID=A0AAE1SVY6_9SOLA|nr:hypothetical protein RND71_006358 [Anisodus tanguticus]
MQRVMVESLLQAVGGKTFLELQTKFAVDFHLFYRHLKPVWQTFKILKSIFC